VKTESQRIPTRRAHDRMIELCMAHLFGEDRCQTLLLPEALDNYVGAENPVRFIDTFVDGLDLAAGGFWSGSAAGDRAPRLCVR
jgi:hypothetical protein